MTTDAPRAAPIGEGERIEALDVLRGFAVLGILTMNIGSFSMPAAAYSDPTAWGELTGLDGFVWGATHLLADLKFMAIFSMLFGAGIALMAERSAAKGASGVGVHYRRMLWLVVFGLLHAHLLWYGDILVWYGVTGLLVYLVRRWSPRTLVAGALGLWLVGSLVLVAGGLSAPSWPPEVRAEVLADMDPPIEVLEAEVRTYRGSWLDQLEHRSPQATEMETSIYVLWAAWRVGGLMLLGMALFKTGFLTGRATTRSYRAALVAALVVGLPLVGLGMRRNFATEWAAPDYFFFGSLYNYWGSIPVALGWVALVMIACREGALAGLRRRLAATGRMACTNYIAQTVICTWIFYGHGLGLFGSVERTAQAGIVAAVWLVQLLFSPWWLSRFRYGPLEWLWRTLVYLRMQPFRRAA